MPDNICHEAYIAILQNEMIVAMGCTEPIAIAYAGALAARLVGTSPRHVALACSGNIIKNVKGVTVPNSGGLRGMEIAVLLGIAGGDADKELAVLESVDDAARSRARAMLEAGVCTTSLVEDADNLIVRCTAQDAQGNTALVEIRGAHTHVTRLERNGESLLQSPMQEGDGTEPPGKADKSLLNVRDILTFAATADLLPVHTLLRRQIELNCAISEAGLAGNYGVQAGRTLRGLYKDGPVALRAAAAAAAGSDARMNGCALPVVINSGSGNQGLTITLPIVLYARELGVQEDTLLRALALGNLMSAHQKRYIGSLSAYCGATSAACAAACAICWMQGGTYEQVCGTVTNTLGTLGGMLCDGAKSSCACKISTAVFTALLGMQMSMEQHCFACGEGLIASNVETTIADIGAVARRGMHPADVQILNLMLDANR